MGLCPMLVWGKAVGAIVRSSCEFTYGQKPILSKQYLYRNHRSGGLLCRYGVVRVNGLDGEDFVRLDRDGYYVSAEGEVGTFGFLH